MADGTLTGELAYLLDTEFEDADKMEIEGKFKADQLEKGGSLSFNYTTEGPDDEDYVYTYKGDFKGKLFEKGTELQGSYERQDGFGGSFSYVCEGITLLSMKSAKPSECCCTIF
jgi:hypothetical protein